MHSSRIYNFGVDKTSRIVYNIHCSRGRGGIGIRARLRGVWETVRVQVPSTALAKPPRNLGGFIFVSGMLKNPSRFFLLISASLQQNSLAAMRISFALQL